MPRTSAAAFADAEFIPAGRPLPAPSYLTDEQKRFWNDLVGQFPPERFRPDARPVLEGLVCHMSIARKLAEQLDEMREHLLTVDTKKGDAQRRTFLRLSRAHIAESHLIAMLSVKLRLVPQSQDRHTDAARARLDAMPAGPRPWDGADLAKPWEDKN
jgi:hypothetical protein